MSPRRADDGLRLQRLALDHLPEIAGLEVDPGQLPFFAPTAEIVEEATRRRDRLAMAIRANGAPGGAPNDEADGDAVGFCVLARDPRDPRCWWLAWFMVDRRRQGRGLGRAALRLILAHLARREGCRRIRLQVTPGNDAARRLYLRAGFAGTGETREGDDVLELAVPDPVPARRAPRRRPAHAAGARAGRPAGRLGVGAPPLPGACAPPPPGACAPPPPGACAPPPPGACAPPPPGLHPP
jgi:diamine N-acetyltransferase